MTLTALADLSGLSQGFLSKVENGKAALDRRSHISAVAGALEVSETDLIGAPHLSRDPVQSAPHAAIPAVRAALMSNTLTRPAADHARPLAELVAEMGRIDRSEYKYIQVGESLPAVLGELHVHAAAPADEAAQRLALETLIEAFQTATWAAKDLGYADLAGIAAMRADEVARTLGDPISKGKAATLRIHTMPGGARDLALAAAEEAADALEPHAGTDTAIHVLGMIVLAAALSATVTYRHERAEDWLGRAADLASRVPDTPGVNWGAFSKTNVGVWQVSLATERGESGAALLEVAEAVDEDRLQPRRGRHAVFLADVGRGLARDKRTRDEAVRWLRHAERVAPHKIRNSAAVHETVATLLTQAKATGVGRELRGMAARMGMAH